MFLLGFPGNALSSCLWPEIPADIGTGFICQMVGILVKCGFIWVFVYTVLGFGRIAWRCTVRRWNIRSF